MNDYHIEVKVKGSWQYWATFRAASVPVAKKRFRNEVGHKPGPFRLCDANDRVLDLIAAK